MEIVNNKTIDNKNVVYTFGDSHTLIFLDIESQKIKTIVAGYDGASISGLNEKTSKLEYGNHVMQIVLYEPKTYFLLFKLLGMREEARSRAVKWNPLEIPFNNARVMANNVACCLLPRWSCYY